MTKDDFKRKLTAILSADVVGYSRLMGEDEESTVRTLNKYKEIIFALIEKNNGRVIDSPGDNVLAEFVSVVDAVRCGVQIQEDLKGHNEELPENRKMQFRIGINIGDVIQDGDRIYGDGVNVASRIESLADPGCICLSRTAYDQVKSKINIDYEYLGEYEVKNIKEPVRVYKVLMESIPDDMLRDERPQELATKERDVYSQSDKPSIVVLPFANISGDPEQEYFSDGMTEEIINALANVEGLKVISRTSSFFFKGKDVSLRTIGAELNVDNVIEGSVRKAGNKIRITAQLIKVTDDTHLWSETYDRELEDIFAIQDEISNAIVDSLKIRLFGKEKEALVKPHTENIDAYQAYIKGRYYYLSFMEGSMEKALQSYEQAINLDPDYALAYSAIAEWYWNLPGTGQKDVSRIDEVYTQAREAINTALEIDNNLPEAHANLGMIKYLYERDSQGAEKAFETAINLNPGLSKPHYDYALYLAWMAEGDKALLEARKAVELDPLSGIPHYALGISFRVSGQFDQALKELQQAHEMMPASLASFIALTTTYMMKDMLDEAMDVVIKGLEIFPRNRLLLSHVGRIKAQIGEKKKTREILDEFLERSQKEYVSPVAIAVLYDGLGEIEKALKYLEDGYDKRDIFLTAPLFLNADPRYNAFFKKIRLHKC